VRVVQSQSRRSAVRIRARLSNGLRSRSHGLYLAGSCSMPAVQCSDPHWFLALVQDRKRRSQSLRFTGNSG